jgi:hypothetical protein
MQVCNPSGYNINNTTTKTTKPFIPKQPSLLVPSKLE